MKIGVAGYGSIGKRHISNLLELGYGDIKLYRSIGRGNDHGLVETTDFKDFVSEDFDLVIVANPATSHLAVAAPFIKRNINLFIEKPVVAGEEDSRLLSGMLGSYTGINMVGYNMRFHPSILEISRILDEEILGRIYSARLCVGQYLPDWRPGQDYRQGVSALKKLGGGVILELIHEIDLAVHLFGSPAGEIASIAGRYSDLEIETEDISEILFRSERGVIVSIHQDYLSRSYRREIEIVGEKATLFCDLKNATTEVRGGNDSLLHSHRAQFERNDMYRLMIILLIESVKQGKTVSPGIREAMQSLEIALMAKKKIEL